MSHGFIALKDGTVIEARGRSPGTAQGELVFTTAYAGYEESLTDPSYEEQILTFSYPLIGNYGVREERFESERIHPSAVVARELTTDVSRWLVAEGVPAVDHLDTRMLVQHIRTEGAMRCGIAVGATASADDARRELDACVEMSDHTTIGQRVSVDRSVEYSGTADGPTIALIDCGVKRSIITSLVERGATVHVVPSDATIPDVREVDPDGLFVSNGPGDPAVYDAAEKVVSHFVGDIPVVGICLGQQIIARVLGGTTEKMQFGHRGVNQPVWDFESGQVVMTTQNHGYVVTETGNLDVTQVNVNDGTPEGLVDEDRSILTRQYHPEAHPGPHDTDRFFDEVLSLVESPPSIA